MSGSPPDWLKCVARVLMSNTGDLRRLALIGGADPRTMYIGTNLDGVDVRGQDLRGMILTDFDIDKVIHDTSTIIDEKIEHEQSDALIYSASRRVMFDGKIDSAVYGSVYIESIEPFIEDALHFDGPIFIIFDERSYGDARLAAEKIRRIGRDFVGVFVETNRSAWTAENRLEASDNINPLVIVHRQGGFFPRSASIPSEAREAIRLLSSSWDRRESLLFAPAVVFMKAKGQGPRPMVDAVAHIFDRLGQLDLTPESSVLILQSQLGPEILEDEIRPIEGLLLPRHIELRKKSPGPMFDISAFVSVRRSSKFDYVEALERSISRGSIGLRLDIYRRPAPETRMWLGRREYFVRPLGRTSKSRLKYDDHPHPMDLIIEEVDSVSITPYADLSSVAAMLLLKRELVVSSRDILGIDSGTEDIWSLIASQTRRLTGPLDGTGRQLYLRILLCDALKRGSIHHSHEELISRICLEDGFFRHYRTNIGRVRFDGRAASFRLRLQNAPFLSPLAKTEVVDAAVTVEVGGVRVDEYDA